MGAFDDKGVTGIAGVVGAVALLPDAGFSVTGISAVIPVDGDVAAFITEDVQLTFAFAPPAPVGVPTPVMSEVAAVVTVAPVN